MIRYVGEEQGVGGEMVDIVPRTFDVPETDKRRMPLNQFRQTARDMRWMPKRRRQHMGEIRCMFSEAGLIDSAAPDALPQGGSETPLRTCGIVSRFLGMMEASTSKDEGWAPFWSVSSSTAQPASWRGSRHDDRLLNEMA